LTSPTFHWRIGGAQGSGIDKAAQLFARGCLQAGLAVLGQREYHSNIAGRHSYFDLALGQQTPLSVAEYPDLLLAMDGETLFRHLPMMRPGSTVIANRASLALGLDRLPYLDAPLRQHLESIYLKQPSAQTLIDHAIGHGVDCLVLDMEAELTALAKDLQQPLREVKRAYNSLLVSLGAALLKLPERALQQAMAQLFPKPEHQQLNAAVIAHGYQLVETHNWPTRTLPLPEQAPQRLLLDATQSVALGKLAAGIGLQSYYPISPATEESRFLETQRSIACGDGSQLPVQTIQVEDEISAACLAAGAALTGIRAATATSGPGFSLMAETLGWAGMNEVPLVITLYQRGGPSTGMPTRTEQGDLLFAIHAGHGEFPRLVMASASTEEAFYDAMAAFNYAERFELPVIHLLDKMLTTSLASVTPFDSRRIPIERGSIAPPGEDRAQPFRLSASGVSPRLPLGQPGQAHWRTGVEHDESGLVTENPQLRERMMEKRAARLALILAELPTHSLLQEYGDADAPLLLFSWGSNLGAVRDAMVRLQQAGHRVRALQLRILWPFPVEAVNAALAGANTTVVVEGNQSGQLATLLQAQTGHHPDHLILKYSGRPICGDALTEALEQILLGHGEATMVLRNPYE